MPVYARSVRRFCCIFGFLAPAGTCLVPAIGQTPTFSLEAVEVNGDAVAGGPTAVLTANPGDLVTAKIFVRDWSPAGESLRGYQARIDPAGYTGQTAGRVEPIGYQDRQAEGVPNFEHAYVDSQDPDYVFVNMQSVSPVDTRSPAYRWLGALQYGGIPSPQDGTRFYCGTLHLAVSDDAAGTFTIGFLPEPGACQLRDEDRRLILPLEFEALVLTVSRDSAGLHIVSSEPPDAAVDARPIDGKAGPGGFGSVRLTFSGDCGRLSEADFDLTDGSASPPTIRWVKADGTAAMIHLDRVITPGKWTTITHRPSGTSVRIGAMPGDVNNDGRVGGGDLLALIDALNGVEKLPIYRTDMDGNGSPGVADILRHIDLLTGRMD